MLTPEKLESILLSPEGFDPKNPKIGIYKGLSNELYHAAGHYSSSKLKRALISIDHFNAPTIKTTKAMDLGSAIHTMILEPSSFKERLKIRPKCALNSNKGKDEYISFLEGFVQHNLDPGINFSNISRSDYYKALEQLSSDQGFHILTDQDKDVLGGIYKNACRVPDNGFYGPLSNGYNELSAFIIDEETGLPIKARWDHISIVNRCIIDVKSTKEDLLSDKLGKVIGDREYDFSAAFYTRVAVQCGFLIDGYHFAWAMNTYPFHVWLVALGSLSLEDATLYNVPKALSRIKNHLEHPEVLTGIYHDPDASIEKNSWHFSAEFKQKLKEGAL